MPATIARKSRADVSRAVPGRPSRRRVSARPAFSRQSRMTSSMASWMRPLLARTLAAARRERLAVQVGDPAAGFGHDQRAAGDVPRLEVALPEPVHAAGRDVAEIDRRRAQPPDGARPADERARTARRSRRRARARRTGNPVTSIASISVVAPTTRGSAARSGTRRRRARP